MLPRAAGAGGSSHNLHAFVCTRPEPFRQLNGPTMDWPYILVILGIAVILYLIGSLRVLRQYERGVDRTFHDGLLLDMLRGELR